MTSDQDIRQDMELLGKREESYTDGFVMFGDNVRIDPRQVLPLYSNGPVKAYSAVDTKDPDRRYAALVCERHLMPRTTASSTYKGIQNTTLLNLAYSGKCYWPAAREERFIFIYNEINAKVMMKEGQIPALGWRQEQVNEFIVKPLIPTLRDFRDRNFYHGSIRPTNMFLAEIERGHSVVLGECLSAPASFAQPVLYETVERAMADPIARGNATISEDLYSLGASLAILLRSYDPMEGVEDREIIRRKIELGSYAALVGNDRFTGSMLELLRGLLHDDPKERWTVDDLLVWFDGRRLSPKQSKKRKKAVRALKYRDQNYVYADLLSFDFHKDPQEATALWENGELEQWLVRSLDDKEVIEHYHNAHSNIHEFAKNKGYQERVVCQIKMALAPEFPLYYKNHSMACDGVGIALVKAFVRNEELALFREMFDQNIFVKWIYMQGELHSSIAGLSNKFDNCRLAVKNDRPGYGLERCIYLLNPDTNCLSPKLSGYFVQGSDQMIMAFEDLCKRDNSSGLFLDRHSIAYLSVLDSKSIETSLFDLNSPDRDRQIMGNLKTLATIQRRYRMPNFPSIGKVFMNIMPDVYIRFRDREVREQIKIEVERLARAGNLSGMAAILDNADTIRRDLYGYRLAKKEYMELTLEYEDLDQRLMHKETYGRAAGYKASAIVSIIMAIIITIFISLSHLSSQSMF